MPKFNQRIKVLLFLPLLAGSVFLFFKYTKAQFFDSEKILGNTIQVGVWGMTPTEIPPSGTPTPTPTETLPETPTPTPTEIIAPTPTETPTPTDTPTSTPTDTPIPTPENH